VARTVYGDPHVTITLDDAAGLVRYTRTARPYASLDELRNVNANLREAFATLPRGHLALLIDVRDAPPRNDPAFEHEILEALTTLAARFRARATLVKSAVGRLQAQRIARDGSSVFFDEAEALAHLKPTR
jgi:hypothetical protein